MKIDHLTNREYQKKVTNKLRTSLNLPVESEWRPMKEQRGLYSPRVDIAVGPFVYTAECIPDEHDSIIAKLQKPINTMLNYHNKNIKQGPIFESSEISLHKMCYKNKTARCLFAIEIEDKISRKHLIGSALNAIALGRLGIVVACSPEKVTAFVRLRHYIWYLTNAIKLDTSNLLILDKQQLVDSFEL